ncbi:GLPGLI family protein [Aequorivita vladivostokensis]|uniref:Ribonuclease Z n=1 Tax=Aequorivita vladivostokensis TaxID=171194 RepID=A0ABR5DMB9_9FLAO|nr:GLPGLI family protein [Aequorivita vladivostokensis]KJJ39921.1 ribonuclease Z [Aequorivita vladivostokensis]MAB56904.1 GLPGLI family protein [Aequorivita sp.]MAO47475.1 GLPGLI family protein [Aequorivita sp.]MBF30925.1 GLPGLI family protein [Aequorivita sp.]
MIRYTLIFLLLLSFSINAQNISGQAFYESKTTVDMDALGGGREMSEEMKKTVAQMMKSALEKTYILTFNKDESIYKEQEKLDAAPMNPGFKMMMSSYTPGAQYKNLKTGRIIEENEFFGKQFLVTDSIKSLDWQITKESKPIGQYIAFKATAIKKVDPNDYSMARPKKKDEKENAEIKKDTAQPQDPMDMIEIPEEIEVTAWFTPQIPVSNGPGEYAGLPGLILELNVYRTTLLCSKIVMNPKDSEKIEPPTKGKKVTREEYVKIVKEKTEELRENFQNRGGNGRRGGFGG